MEFTKIFVKVITIYYFVSCVVAESEEICIKGRYHKDKPSPETDQYKACSPWKNLTCCTVNLDRELAQNDSPSQYNQTWHHCGSLSQECLKFWKRQVWFFTLFSNRDFYLPGCPVLTLEILLAYLIGQIFPPHLYICSDSD